MVDYNAAFKKPFLDIKNLVIGILLSIVPIINWFAVGYTLECTGLTKKRIPLDKPLGWSDWSGLFVKGFFSFVISLVYLLPAIIIFAVGVLPAIWGIMKESFLSSMTGSTDQFVVQNLDKFAPAMMAAIPFIILTGLFALLAAYFGPMAVMRYLSADRFGAGFDFKKVYKKAFTKPYFVAWLLAIIILVVIQIVMKANFIAAAASSFIGGVIFYSILGQAYKEIKG
jgi:hypothetical protein